MYFQLLLGTWVWQTDVIWRSFKRWNGFLLLKSQWLVTLCISHLLQAARMEQWENQTTRLRNLACYSCIKHRNYQLDSLSLYTHPCEQIVLYSAFFSGQLWWLKNPVQLIERSFLQKFHQSWWEEKISLSENRFSSLTKYCRILNFFNFPLWLAAKCG